MKNILRSAVPAPRIISRGMGFRYPGDGLLRVLDVLHGNATSSFVRMGPASANENLGCIAGISLTRSIFPAGCAWTYSLSGRRKAGGTCHFRTISHPLLCSILTSQSRIARRLPPQMNWRFTQDLDKSRTCASPGTTNGPRSHRLRGPFVASSSYFRPRRVLSPSSSVRSVAGRVSPNLSNHALI